MEREFSVSRDSSSCASADMKGTTRKFISVCISILLMMQIMLVGFQAFGAQTAYGATLPNNLVYKYAYGVRSDGIACFRNNGYDGVIVNSSGKVVFKEVYKNRTVSYEDYSGKTQTYTYKQSVLNTSGDVMNEAGCYGGNLLICKTVYDPHEETSPYTDWDGKHQTYTVEYRYYYGLLNPQTGKYTLPTTSTYEEVMAYCKKRGWKTQSAYSSPYEKQKLPNGMTVQLKYADKTGYRYVDGKGNTAKIAGYELGNSKKYVGSRSEDFSSVIFRKGVAGGNLYYVRNTKGKVGAVNDKGKVLIPFEYDAYSDAGVGSPYILLKKGNSWKYFNLNTIGKSSSSSVAQTAKWMKGSKGWWYRYSNGSYAKGLKKIGNVTYYFDSNGWMKTGWQKISGSWYYFNGSGVMKTGWQKIGKSRYLMASNGKMLTGWRTVSGKKYYLGSDGAMRTGWLKSGGAWYYLASSGAMAKGWTKTGGKWYYMNSKGKMLTGWQTLGGKKYYLGSDGAMKTGWQKLNNAWYYFNGSGVMVSNRWVGNYYMESNGKMATNKWVDNGKYYVGSNGALVRGKSSSSASASSVHSHNWVKVTSNDSKIIGECPDCGATRYRSFG